MSLTCGLPKRVHLLGIGGAGVSGAARILVARGHVVSGHDRAESELLRALGEGTDQARLTYSIGSSGRGDLPGDAGLVVRSAAIPDDDPQVVGALERGLPVMKYAELLGRLAPRGAGLAVAGTHGKTTTTWMLWYVLDAMARAGFGRAPDSQPSALVGGLLHAGQGTPTNAIAGDSDGWFAMEACEYDRSFLELAPFGSIVTNVEADHLDYYGDMLAIEVAFGSFLGKNSPEGLVVVGPEVADNIVHSANGDVWRLGRELQVNDEGPVDGRRRFVLSGPGWATKPVHLSVPGAYNVENAALALGLGIGLGMRRAKRELWPEMIAAAVAGVEAFVGVGRRFESWGSIDGVDVVHDYAHHPTELKALLGAAREAFPGRPVHLLFQPHQASRTARFLEDFAKALSPDRLERLVVAPVYGARKHIDGDMAAGSAALAELVGAAGCEAVAPPTLTDSLSDFASGLCALTCPVALVVGAGDIEDVREPLLEMLRDGAAQTIS